VKKIIHYTNPDFWNLLDQICNNTEWMSAVYSNSQLNYYQQQPLNKGLDVDNNSFILQWEGKPVAAFFGSLIRSKKDVDFHFNEVPCVLVENKEISSKAIKCFLGEFERILSKVNGTLWFRDYITNGNVSFLTNYILKKGASVVPVFTRVLDLSNDERKLKSRVRKSYSSLINAGLRDLKPYVVTSNNVSWDDFLCFRELHILASGRETRSIDSWKKQFEAVKSNEAFLVFGQYEGEIVTAGYFIYNKVNCIYGSSASRRDLFHKPIFHAIMWTAVIYAKHIGCKWFEAGEQLFENYCTRGTPTKKEIDISTFKSGFGGDNKIHLDLKVNHKK
jgi:hypothetical protein